MTDPAGDRGERDGAERDALLADLHRPFRPRAGRIVPVAVAVAGVATFVVVAAVLPDASVGDRVGIAATALLLALILSLFARVSAVPRREGLTVRNLVRTTTFEWPRIVSVTFGRDWPWAYLDLADGTTAPVMAIQAADGSHGQAEARRLATLVEFYSRSTG